MAKIKIQVTTPGARAAADSLLKLSAAERKVALEAAGVSKAMNKTGRAGKRASGSMLAGFKQVGGALVGIASGAAAVAASVRLIRQEFDRLKKIDTGAFTAQKTMKDAVGKFLINNPQTSQAELSKMVAASQKTGAVLGAGGGVAAFNALIAIRGQTPGASPEAQERARDIAVGLKKIDPDVNMAAFAANAIKIQEASKQQGNEITMDQAFKTLLFTGARAGGDISTLAQSTIRLGGMAGPATGTTLPDLLSLFAFMTAETGDETGKRSATTVGTLLSGLQSRPLMVALDPSQPEKKTQIKLAGESGLEKLLDLVKRIKAEEFGEMGETLLGSPEVANIMRSSTMLGGGSEAMALLGKLIISMDKFIATREAINEARVDTDVVADLTKRQEEIMPTAAGLNELKKAEGDLDKKKTFATRAAARQAAREKVLTDRETFEISTFRSPRMKGAGPGAVGGGLGFNFDRMMQVFLKTPARDVAAKGEEEIAQILADRILGPGGAMDDQAVPRDRMGRRMETPEHTMAKRLLRQAKTSEEITDIIARFLLVGEDEGIDEAERQGLEKRGATLAQLNALSAADLRGNLTEALAELILALREDTAATREATTEKATTTDTVTTTTPTASTTVPIDANE